MEPQAHERILQEGMLSKDTTYKIIVRGNISAKEIQRMINKLELDKEILSDISGDGNTE